MLCKLSRSLLAASYQVYRPYSQYRRQSNILYKLVRYKLKIHQILEWLSQFPLLVLDLMILANIHILGHMFLFFHRLFQQSELQELASNIDLKDIQHMRSIMHNSQEGILNLKLILLRKPNLQGKQLESLKHFHHK